MSAYRIIPGEAVEALRLLPSNSFDGSLCDPPYGLDFMGKDWDRGVPGPLFWAELRRVLVPGAYLLAFGGSRTHHRLMCAIEDGGFEISDCIMWLYGQGFPKSLDIQKAMDKENGTPGPVISEREEHDICRPAGGRDERLMTSRGRRETRTIQERAPGSEESAAWHGYGTALKPAWEPIIIAMKPIAGSFVENARSWGVAGLNIQGNLIGSDAVSGGGGFASSARHEGYQRPGQGQADKTYPHVGRWPANVVLDDEVTALLDDQSGVLTSGNNPATRNADKHRRVYAGWKGSQCLVRRPTDSGGASRFFYCAKASQKERGPGNDHPTVKPLKLTEHLASLTLPPPGRIRRLVVPFSGSGSEMIGALRAGWDEVVGIELNPEYAAIAEKRLRADAQLNQTEATA